MSSSSSITAFSASSSSSNSFSQIASIDNTNFSLEKTNQIKKLAHKIIDQISVFEPNRNKGEISFRKIEYKLLNSCCFETLKIFKSKIGEEAYRDLSSAAENELKKIISRDAFPKAHAAISTNYSLLTKRIFCDLFKKIKLMGGDGFLKKLFPEELSLAAKIDKAQIVIQHSIDPSILEKMHRWIEDQNLVKMIRSIVRDNYEISIGFKKPLPDIDDSSYEEVHARAEGVRRWLNDNKAMLLNISHLDLTEIDSKSPGLTSIPQEISLFANLKELLLYNNDLTYIPKVLENLKNLENLGISNVCLASTPETVGSLVKA
jgi:hypothetical protein